MSTDRPEADRAGLVLAPLLKRYAVYLLAFTLLLFLLVREGGLTVLLFREQDFAILLLAGTFSLALAAWRRPLPIPPLLARVPVMVIALLVIAVTVAGTWLVFGAYPLTRDELLADFDADFLSQGRLIGPLPLAWAPFASALMPQYMLPLAPETGWMSGYLPGNAALRALADISIGRAWTNPVLAGIAVVALARIGARLWPQAPRTAIVPVILLASSAQFLATAMTAYAMTAHLTFNLLWLWAFLRDDRRGDAAAIAAGFVATGLHQLLFHPLFVLPFLIQLWIDGRRRRFFLFVISYALIGLFWAAWWQLLLAGLGAAPDQASASGIAYLVARLLHLIAAFEATAPVTMMFNLLRFVSWQNLLLVPLALLSWRAVRRGEGMARPLFAGIILTLAAMLILLPWQGHGWGYRYLHGLIGSFCLLAGYGWRAAAEHDGGARRKTAIAAATAVSLLLVLPVHLYQAHAFVAPYRSAQQAIARSEADIVIIDPRGTLFADDLARNAPDLSNRPLVMTIDGLDATQLQWLCRHHSVLFFGRDEAARFGIRPMEESRPRRARPAACTAAKSFSASEDGGRSPSARSNN